MFLREENAREKWCPFATQAVGEDGAFWDTRQQSKGYTLCVASDCMAWRWSRREDGRAEGHLGYCGAAGRP